MAWPMDSSMMGWMMAVCVALVVLLVYFAYRYGRMAQRVENLGQGKP